MRWAVPAEHAELPTPQQEAEAAAAAAAVLAPHAAALSERLAAAGPWPHGATLLPAPGSAAGAAAAAVAGPELPPEGITCGRVFVSKSNTISDCFERNVFISNK